MLTDFHKRNLLILADFVEKLEPHEIRFDAEIVRPLTDHPKGYSRQRQVTIKAVQEHAKNPLLGSVIAHPRTLAIYAGIGREFKPTKSGLADQWAEYNNLHLRPDPNNGAVVAQIDEILFATHWERHASSTKCEYLAKRLRWVVEQNGPPPFVNDIVRGVRKWLM